MSEQRMDREHHEHSHESIVSDDEEEEYTTSESSDDEVQIENLPEQLPITISGNLLHRTTLNHLLNTNQNTQISFVQVREVVKTSNDQMLEQTMVLLAAKHRHTRSTTSSPSENEILSFHGPCPLYSLQSSLGLDMHHGLSNFPCRHILAAGSATRPVPLWQHLTSFHNLNLSSTSLLICHLLLHGYSLPSNVVLFNKSQSILRSTPRLTFSKACPLTRYGVCGVRYAHGARLCSGYTLNTNLYTHLISFHRMTNEAALRLARAIAFHDRQFRFQPSEVIVDGARRTTSVLRAKVRDSHPCQINWSNDSAAGAH